MKDQVKFIIQINSGVLGGKTQHQDLLQVTIFFMISFD